MKRFAAKFFNENGCHTWTGFTDSSGYPRFFYFGKKELAAKVAFEFSGTTLPKGAILHNECGNRLCVNPKHFRVGATHVKPTLRRLKREDVEEMKNQHIEGASTYSLAKKFACSTRMVRNIIEGRSWKNV